MEGNEIENLGIRIKQQIAEKIEDYASIQSEPLRKEIERLNAELTRANARIEELSQWKEDQIKLWLPVIEFMQEQSNMKWGGSISEEVLKRLKETNDLYNKQKL